MDIQSVVFTNKSLDLRLAGLLHLPEQFDLNKNYPALVVTGPMLSVKEQAQHIYAEALARAGYVTLTFDGSYFGESQGQPRQLEIPEVKQTDIESAVDYLLSLPFVDGQRIGGMGICGSGSYMSVAGVKDDRLKVIAAVVPAISDIANSPMTNFFLPDEEVRAAKEAYEAGTGSLVHLNFMPKAFEEGAQYYYSSRGNHPRWSSQAVAWSQLELKTYNVTEIMRQMHKPYLVITAENAWSKSASQEIFEAAPSTTKTWVELPEAGHFDLYDLAPFTTSALAEITRFLAEHL